jgi:uncharacterized protein YjlB
MKSPRLMYFGKSSDVPNSGLPVLIYRAVLASATGGKAERFRERFRKSGWTGLWIDTVYDYTHFHSNAHEVLGIAEGKVSIRLGGDRGRLLRLKAGDMLVIPAGVGHKRIGDDDGLKVIGAYPRGQSKFDIKRTGHREPHVRLPKTDPFYGEDGPLVGLWVGKGIPGRKMRA